MGKRKRYDKSDIIENLYKKVKKLAKRRRISSSSSSADAPESPEYSSLSHQDINIASDQQEEIPPIEAPLEETASDNYELDPDILQLLGSDPTQTKSFGDNLHKDLVTRWKHILINGLSRDEKVDLLKQYLPAENCAYMKAPILNAEIKSAISETNIKKDSYGEQKQNQLSSCISAIGRALNLALSHSDTIPQEIIKTLSDAGRLVCDAHHRESLSRRFSIINSLSKQKRDLIKNTKIDDHLFGTNLSEYIKSSKAISLSASELRFSQTHRVQASSFTSRQPAPLNARGAPRATAAEPRVYPGPSQPRRLPPPPVQRDYRRAPQMTSRVRTTNYSQQTRRR